MNPRKILGVDNDATKDEIVRAYRDKVRKHHPDAGGDAWAFQKVQQAYESLIGPESETSPSSTPPEANRENTSPENTNRETFTGAASHHSAQPTHPPTKGTEPDKKTQPKAAKKWWQIFFHQLPLQNETTTFIMVNVLDIFMTYILLRFNAVEANPFANYFYLRWGFNGMIAFKLVIVTCVCVIAQIVATRKLATAKFLLVTGTLLTGAVVVYSVLLFTSHFRPS